MNGSILIRRKSRPISGHTQGKPWEEDHEMIELIAIVQEGRGSTRIVLEFDAGDFSRALAKPNSQIAAMTAAISGSIKGAA